MRVFGPAQGRRLALTFAAAVGIIPHLLRLLSASLFALLGEAEIVPGGGLQPLGQFAVHADVGNAQATGGEVSEVFGVHLSPHARD